MNAWLRGRVKEYYIVSLTREFYDLRINFYLALPSYTQEYHTPTANR